MIGGNTRLQCGEDEDFFAGIDLENAAAAVTDIEIAVVIECDPGGDAHPLNECLRVARRIHPVHVAFKPARNVQVASQAEGQTCGIHDVGHKRRHCRLGRNLVD